MSEVSMTDMLKAGMHFGHKSSKRHPKMDPFIFDEKKGISVIDLEKTKEQLEKAGQVAADLASHGKIILFVGTKRQAQAIVKKAAENCGMPYITERWIGGLITNYTSVSQTMRKLSRLKKEKETGELNKYTKKERLQFTREIEKLDTIVGGIESMDRVPDAIFLVGVKDEITALREAATKKIPVIGICDTNTNPDKVTYPIPANDDAVKSLEYIVNSISQAISTAPKAAPPEAPKKPIKNEAKEVKKEVKK
ncbi:30S ribosomal protein S2 [Patescibacteria group bacterium]|nr:30S ribosomal protein S2 [Patescibacteria group bacterium]MBU1673133.1 30S ribosomal protein S2 [Patescibacteria group bacterium]MBU1963811.1 30S ribosomal protein S2 [Patescibacteria group bacterium]